MKNIVTLLIVAVITGAVGYWAGRKSTQESTKDLDTNSVTLRWKGGYSLAPPPHPITSIGYQEALSMIDSFYILASKNPKSIVDKMPHSYAIDNAAIGKIFQGANPQSNMRLYPALNSLGNVSMVLALEDENGKMQFSTNTKAGDEKLWDYIDPCPDDCPPLSISGKNDFYTCQEWADKLEHLRMSPKVQCKSKPAIP